MMRNQRSLRNEIRVQAAACPTGRRGGAVIIVVVSLMTTLLFLGLFFYSWTSQERATAEFYGNTDPLEVDPDPIFDFGLQQVISHTDSSRQNSALYGSRWSMLSHVIGTMNADGTPTDLIPYNGNGISVRINSSLTPNNWRTSADSNNDGHVDITDNKIPMTDKATFWFDYVGNGDSATPPSATATDLNDILKVNFSRSANGGTDYTNSTAYPQYSFTPDSGYTYPDVNSLFLSYEDPSTGLQIPSYFRPQYLPLMRKTQDGFNNLYTDTNYKSMVLRPHAYHTNASDNTKYRYATGTLGPSTGTVSAKSGDQSRVLSAFPFNVDVDKDSNYNECGVLSSPPSIGTASRTLEFDADADGDGVRDSIYIDLDHPITDLSGGRQVVPLFYFKVVDADGLLNLNVHGNQNLSRTLSGAAYNYPVANFPYTHPYGNDTVSGNVRSIHTSNLGMSVSEINPSYALFSDPFNASFLDSAYLNSVFRDHGSIFAFSPSSYYSSGTVPRDRIAATANMEMTFLLKGHTDSAGGQPYLGRWSTGSGTEVVDFTTMAGLTGTDDDGDFQRGGRFRADDYLTALTQPPFVHPLDYIGQSQHPNITASNDPRRSLGGNAPTGSPGAWPSYDPKWQETDQTQSANVSGVQSLRASATTVQNYADSTALSDEPNEMIVEPGRRNYAKDRLFESSEMAALHLSNSDWATGGVQSRLRNLLPMNFEFSRQAEGIRQQFTTDSWDRKELGYPLSFGRLWEIQDGTTARFPPSFGTAASGKLEQITSKHENATFTPGFDDLDPFRPVLRRLLATTVVVPQAVATSLANFSPVLTSYSGNTVNFGSGRTLPQQKLNLNKLLVNFDSAGNPIYRELTPHPVINSGDLEGTPQPYLVDSGTYRPLQHANIAYSSIYYDGSGNLANLDPTLPATGTFRTCPLSDAATNKYAQEVWARHDRQRMARDIYVLLYTTGWGGVNFDPTKLSPTLANLSSVVPGSVDSDGDTYVDAVKEMAQFAVNAVDALDRDGVITRFDYDPDLSDGWDTNPTNLKSVYGVESQSLVFSEACLVRTATSASTDNATTLYKEDNEVHQFLTIELRNASPFSVNLAANPWRIARVSRNGSAVASKQAEVEIKGSPRTNSGSNNVGSVVGAGENFLISCHDGNVRNGSDAQIPSDIYVNYDGVNLKSIIPYSTLTVPNNTSAPTQPLADLDLASTATTPFNHGSYYTFILKAAGGTTTTLVEPDPAVGDFDLVLLRRKNLQDNGVLEDEWIEADRFQVEPRTFTASNDPATNLSTNLGSIYSQERYQPLDWRSAQSSSPLPQKHTLATSYNSPAPSYVSPTVTPNQRNSISTGNWTLWQPHFDRDFSSSMELLAVPLYGPFATFSSTAPSSYQSTTMGSTAVHFADQDGFASGHFTAQVRFMNPQSAYPSDTGSTAFYANSPPNYQNTWYRLLQFVTTEPAEHQFDENNAALIRREPGKLNINTLRHEPVYAGLVDDRVHLDPFGRFASNSPNYPSVPGASGNAMTLDVLDSSPTSFSSAGNSFPQYPSTQRVWYQQLQIARDGLDPVLTSLASGSSNSNVTVPGLPGSSPFRPVASVDPNAAVANDAIDNGLLREMPEVRSLASQRGFGLFDARSVADFGGGSGNFLVDFHTAKRLLAKVANQTTARSHVFVIYAGYDLFEAHQPTASTVQIGAKADDLPGRRMFLVVDMSRLEEAYNPTTNTFDFRKFIIHRQLLP